MAFSIIKPTHQTSYLAVHGCRKRPSRLSSYHVLWVGGTRVPAVHLRYCSGSLPPSSSQSNTVAGTHLLQACWTTGRSVSNDARSSGDSYLISSTRSRPCSWLAGVASHNLGEFCFRLLENRCNAIPKRCKIEYKYEAQLRQHMQIEVYIWSFRSFAPVTIAGQPIREGRCSDTVL